MIDLFRTRKSNGIRVGASAYKSIRQGDAARDSRDWRAAAEAYRRALEIEPSLAHIWVQYGHMSKEAGAYSVAASAYVEAVCLRPDDPAVLQWLYAIAGQVGVDERGRLAEVLRSSRGDTLETSSAGQAGETVFDISDLVSYFAKARLPTGIQRVQIETIRSLIQGEHAGVRVCCAIEGRGDWTEVSMPMFLRLAELSVLSGDREDVEWITTLNTLHLDLMLADPIRFGQGATLVNLGTSWWLQNYFLQVRNAKAAFDIRYVPFVHDLIPIIAPQHCVDGLVKDFVSWIIGVFEHADAFLVASEATEHDLRAVAREIGHEIPAELIGHVPLNADFRPLLPASRSPDAVLRGFGLAGQPYVLFVSTIESRKGHTIALDAWKSLLERHASGIPTLVCVGNDGWLNQEVYTRIEQSPALKQKVVFLSRISDADLAMLYRECLFTIYPSLYEGWGLPVTEALCHGKAVITCDNSSLPQAGGAFAIFVETGSSEKLAHAVESLCFEDMALLRAQEHIERDFEPRSWSEIGADILALSGSAFARAVSNRRYARPVDRGRWYDLTRNDNMRIWHGAASAEMYRVGAGWAVPDERCAWILPAGGRLAVQHVDTPSSCRLIVRLFARRPTEFQIVVDGMAIGKGSIMADEWRWMMLPLELGRSGTCIIDIVPGISEGEPDIAVGIAGFALCGSEAEELVGPLEAIAFDRLEAIAAFREPSPPVLPSAHTETDAA
jgi:glycosyltransferase involved in cell wall biosynthesis